MANFWKGLWGAVKTPLRILVIGITNPERSEEMAKEQKQAAQPNEEKPS